MRPLLLILGTVIVIVAAGALYVSMQSTPPQPAARVQIPTTRAALRPVNPRPAGSTTSPTTEESMPIVQSGQDVWVTVPDEAGGIKWEFKFSRYDPKPDNSVDVDSPEAKFYLKNGQVVTLRGVRGRVIIPATTAKSTDVRTTVVAPPSRGELKDVTISMFDPTDLDTPTLVAKMNNVSFDNDTYRIATEQFTQSDGTVVTADQVPVQVRGKDYDFDGRGLIIQWNDRDQRLETMEVAHGESLTIKTLANSSSTTRPAAPAIEAPVRPPPQVQARGRRGANARGATPPQRIAAAPTTRNVEPPTYRATFQGGVRVTQLDESKVDQTIASAQTMQVDFKPDQQEESTPTPRPAPVPPPGRRGARRGQAAPAQPPAAPVRVPSTAPTTQRQNSLARELFPTSSDKPGEPYVIHWPGKLVVVPVNNPTTKLQPGQQMIEMTSGAAPVVLNHQGNEIQCASFVYNDADGGLIVRSSEKFPLISMKDGTGKVLYTPSMVYSGTTQKAHLEGPSHAEIPLDTGLMKTAWTKSCDLIMVGESTDKMTIQQADIIGDVTVDNPQLKLQADALHTEFAPSTDPTKKGVEPKQMVARGNVKCDMTQADQTVQHIVCNTLELTTRMGPDGKITPDRVIADGQVHTFDDAQEMDLRSGQLEVTIAPTTRPTDPIRVQRLVARDDVRFANKDATGTANRLEAEMAGGDRDDVTLMLTGTQPLATITTGDSTLVGQDITIRQNQAKNQQSVYVRGEGKMNGTQRQSPNEKPTPYEVAWTQYLDFDAATNKGKVEGDVVIVTTTSDGTKNTMTGQTLKMELADDPSAATQPSKAPGGVNAMMGKKSLREVILDGNCEIKSILADADGNLLRRVHVFAPTVQVNNASGDDWRMMIPTAGRMLVDDRRPTTHPATQQAGGTAAMSLGDMNGATAFQWERQLVYDQIKNTAELTGNVRIVHHGEGQVGDPPEIDAQQVSAEFEKEESTPGANPSTQPTAPQKVKLKRLIAEGDVWFRADTIEFASQSMTFDPIAETIDARGNNEIPVQVYGKNSTAHGSWEQATWNTRTQKVKLRSGQSTVPH